MPSDPPDTLSEEVDGFSKVLQERIAELSKL